MSAITMSPAVGYLRVSTREQVRSGLAVSAAGPLGFQESSKPTLVHVAHGKLGYDL